MQIKFQRDKFKLKVSIFSNFPSKQRINKSEIKHSIKNRRHVQHLKKVPKSLSYELQIFQSDAIFFFSRIEFASLNLRPQLYPSLCNLFIIIVVLLLGTVANKNIQIWSDWFGCNCRKFIVKFSLQEFFFIQM